MKLLEIEFAFQPRSKSGVQSEVQSEVQKVVQSYCLGWHFQTCYQKIVSKIFFLQYLDTRRTKISHYMIQIGFEMLLLSQILLFPLLQLQLQLLLQVSESMCSCCCSSCCSTGSQQFTILKSVCVKYVVFLSSLYPNIEKITYLLFFDITF